MLENLLIKIAWKRLKFWLFEDEVIIADNICDSLVNWLFNYKLLWKLYRSDNNNDNDKPDITFMNAIYLEKSMTDLAKTKRKI